MTTRDDVVVFGKTTLTSDEHDALHMLGYGLHTLGRRLHTTRASGTAAAVSEGYRLAGGEPIVLKEKGLNQLDATIVAIIDPQISAQLDRRLRFDWRTDDRWFVLNTPYEVVTASEIMLTVLDETDRRHLVLPMVEGGGEVVG